MENQTQEQTKMIKYPNNNEVENIQISPEENEVITFINELQLNYESEAQVKIAEQVKEKFGDLGKKVLEQLNESVEISDFENECAECGEVSEEWLNESQEKLKNVEIFLSDEYDNIVEELKEKCCLQLFDIESVKEIIVKHTDFTMDNIPDDYILNVKKAILFDGIIDGWLIEENFES